MIMLNSLTEMRAEQIGKEIAEAFYAENGTYRSRLSFDECVGYFQAVVSVASEGGCLYADSPDEKGYFVCWRKGRKPKALWLNLMRKVPRDALKRFRDSLDGWQDCEKYFSKRSDYLFLFLIAIKNQYKGTGLFRIMMNEIFKQADGLGLPCVLDSDSRMKAEKYEKVGMKIRKQAVLSSGETMFTLEYENQEDER